MSPYVPLPTPESFDQRDQEALELEAGIWGDIDDPRESEQRIGHDSKVVEPLLCPKTQLVSEEAMPRVSPEQIPIHEEVPR